MVGAYCVETEMKEIDVLMTVLLTTELSGRSSHQFHALVQVSLGTLQSRKKFRVGMPPPESTPKPKPARLPPLTTPAKKPVFFAPDVSETLDSRLRVGKWMNADTHPVHMEGEGESRRLVTRGGTDAAEHVRNSNGHVFYEAHGGNRRNTTGDERKKERTLEVATGSGSSKYLGESAAASVFANSFSDARSVTVMACHYGLGKGKALETMADKMHEAGAESVSLRAPTTLFARQTLPGPGVLPTAQQRKVLPPIERRRETMTKPDNTQLAEFLGTKFWRGAEGGSNPVTTFPEIGAPEPKPAAKRSQSQPPTKPKWR